MRDFTAEIDRSIDAFIKIKDKSSGKRKLLSDGKLIYLQIGLFKIPSVSGRTRKFLELRHSLYGDDPEICLFVPNRKTGVSYKKTTDELIDFCVDYYTEVLDKHKVKGITTVMPLKQLKSEYGTYELRRKLVNRFNIFLCKNSLLYNHRFLTALGKIFKAANKEPLGIPFPKDDCEYDPEFNKNIERALFTSSFYIKPFSDNYSIPFGTFLNTKKELKENLKGILDQLLAENMIPGGFKNVRAMYIWPSQCKTIPFYICLDLPEKLPVPKVRSKRKRIKAEEGELSTQPGKKVKVMANGDVIVINEKDLNFEDLDNESDSSFVDESDEEENVEEQSKKQKNKSGQSDEESESENDELIEEMEQKLLKKKKENDYTNNEKEGSDYDDEDKDEEDSYETPEKKKRKYGNNTKKMVKVKKTENSKKSSKEKIAKREEKLRKVKRKVKKLKNKIQNKETKFNSQGKSKFNNKLKQNSNTLKNVKSK